MDLKVGGGHRTNIVNHCLSLLKMDKRHMFYGSTGGVFENARLLRNNETPAEKLLWTRLNKNQLNGFRFKRQHPIAGYIADFYCHKLKLVIEVDEPYHNQMEQKLKDDNRNKVMSEFGLKVLRFSEADILNSLEKVLNEIKSCINSNPFKLP